MPEGIGFLRPTEGLPASGNLIPAPLRFLVVVSIFMKVLHDIGFQSCFDTFGV